MGWLKGGHDEYSSIAGDGEEEEEEEEVWPPPSLLIVLFPPNREVGVSYPFEKVLMHE